MGKTRKEKIEKETLNNKEKNRKKRSKIRQILSQIEKGLLDPECIEEEDY